MDDVQADPGEVTRQLAPMLRGDVAPAEGDVVEWTERLRRSIAGVDQFSPRPALKALNGRGEGRRARCLEAVGAALNRARRHLALSDAELCQVVIQVLVAHPALLVMAQFAEKGMARGRTVLRSAEGLQSGQKPMLLGREVLRCRL